MRPKKKQLTENNEKNNSTGADLGSVIRESHLVIPKGVARRLTAKMLPNRVFAPGFGVGNFKHGEVSVFESYRKVIGVG